VTNRHVLLDEATSHRPDRLEIELHIDPENVAVMTQFPVSLCQEDKPLWREGVDAGGNIDVAAVELERSKLPKTISLHSFSSAHLIKDLDQIEVGTGVIVVGFPLGFQDTVHHLPVTNSSTHLRKSPLDYLRDLLTEFVPRLLTPRRHYPEDAFLRKRDR
jgi:hypothetical protein